MLCRAGGNELAATKYQELTDECDKFNLGNEYFVQYCKKGTGTGNADLMWAAYQCIKASTNDVALSAQFNLFGARSGLIQFSMSAAATTQAAGCWIRMDQPVLAEGAAAPAELEMSMYIEVAQSPCYAALLPVEH